METMPKVIYWEDGDPSKWFWAVKTENGRVLIPKSKPYADERGARKGFTRTLRALSEMYKALERGEAQY